MLVPGESCKKKVHALVCFRRCPVIFEHDMHPRAKVERARPDSDTNCIPRRTQARLTYVCADGIFFGDITQFYINLTIESFGQNRV
jgi:hypothetical protein